MRGTRYVGALVCLLAACSRSEARPKAATFEVSSSAFAAGATFPKLYTCDGSDLSPPLTFSGVPAAAKSLALYVEDPDAPDPAAPKMVWAHWVAYDLPASTRSLDAGSGNPQKLGRAGKNDWGSTGYRGPCPPVGKHRYFIRVFALDRELGDLTEPKKADLVRAMEGHVLARGELMGTYQKK